ncbi:MAG: glycine cleavage system protein H, partial [Bdellovibrionales bacterium]|nr:glycine cleavage system protein H [Bdellovibrionales bacterium]
MSSKPTEYSSGLLWFTREGDQITLGVTDAALEELGSVESVEFAEPG